MAISPPSDLVLDVVRAADRSQVAAAQEQMKASRAAFAANSLAEAGQGFGATVDILQRSAAHSASAARIEDSAERGELPGTPPKIYRDLEAVYLTNFVSTMLPQDSEEVYGKGNAGDMWKSMMAEQLGSVIAESGGVGIAKQLYQDALERRRGEDIANASTDETGRDAVRSFVADLERRTLGAAIDHNKP